jgi:raffinose/stachyose/melibiose transport system permease protein
MKDTRHFIVGSIAVAFSLLIFGLPLYFVIINSFKTTTESAALNLNWPKAFEFIANYKTVLMAQDGMVVRAFYNSSLLTVLSIVVLIFVSSMAGFVMQRRIGKFSSLINFLILAGLMIPPSIVPTIWVLNMFHLFKTLTGITLIEVALAFPFSAILFQAFMATIPREIDESAHVDGSNGFQLFSHIVFPLLKPVTSTVIVLSAVNIFNDFVNPLYFFPGAKNATVQLALYNFMGMYLTNWNLLFADIVLISIPPLILFIFFNKKIVAGLTAGAVKG